MKFPASAFRPSFRTTLAVGFGLAALCLTSAAIGAPIYAVTDLGTLGGSNTSEAFGINNNGQVVGLTYYSSNYEKATLFNTSGGPNIDLSGGVSISTAYSINDSGQVVGTRKIGSDFWASNYYATLFNTSGGANTNLEPLRGPHSSIAFSINNSGQVVGISQIGHATLFSTTGGTNTDLGTLPGGTISIAQAINDNGMIVGFSSLPGGVGGHATLFNTSGGPNTDLGTLPGGTGSYAVSISNSGEIVGYVSISGTVNSYTHAAIFNTSGGPNIDLGIIGDIYSYAFGVNDNGQIVGEGINSTSGLQSGIIWNNGIASTLDLLINPASGWHISEARGINDLGQIAATGYDSTLHSHALLLSPISPTNHQVPEPGTLLIFAGGLLGMAAKRRKRC